MRLVSCATEILLNVVVHVKALACVANQLPAQLTICTGRISSLAAQSAARRYHGRTTDGCAARCRRLTCSSAGNAAQPTVAVEVVPTAGGAPAPAAKATKTKKQSTLQLKPPADVPPPAAAAAQPSLAARGG